MSDAWDVRRINREAPLVDVHIHPPLKGWLFDRSLSDESINTKFFNPFSNRTSLRSLEEGGFRVIWATHYVPELGLFEDSRIIRWAAKAFMKHSQITSGSPFSRLEEMMTQLEQDVESVSERAEMAQDFEETKRILEDEKIAVIHAVEGGHVLERDLSKLNKLSERGVVSLTLTHFYPNGIARQVDAIPDSMLIKKLSSFNFFNEEQEPLTEFGKDVLEKMDELGMVPDLTHSAPDAREEIFKHAPPGLPINATHVGVEANHSVPMNLRDDELEEIAKRDGAVGVIFFNYWLDSENPGDGLPSLWKTIEHIYEVTGSWDHIMVGTDFDGFTNPPDDLSDASKFSKFTEMLLEKGLPKETVKKILGGNAMRIMKNAWKSTSTKSQA